MGSTTPDGVTSTDPDPGPAEEATRLGELAAGSLLSAPTEAEGYLRAALAAGTGVLSEEQIARLHAQLVTALSGAPDREAELAEVALDAARHWEELSGDTATHLVFVAARALHRAGRHARAAELFARALAKAAPYPVPEMAVLRGQYGRSLRLLSDHRGAARQYLAAAHAIRGHADQRELRAELTWSAASALDACGADGPAALAYLRAAELWGELGRTGPRARCLRSAAWLRFWAAPTGELRGPSIEALRSLLAELQERAERQPSREIANELDHTRRQLTDMLDSRSQ
ncbi:hypothetical protein IU449_20820 [Nocardia higoensis]|uniref:Tetratricopeptide repeat protein n=1 Tax=Nocardia higoensis TaxID=228599 RepID=A0ABS0DES7_9NOCA|nr:hypothetical protein [Nocardia higoensis]MBF6356956.1 hypothetical protein [Nocardia higoensis]